MFRTITFFLVFAASLTNVNAQGRLQEADIVVSASIERIRSNQTELVVTAKIADGLHIYGQDQAKPFLATKISVAETSASITDVGELRPDRDPITVMHPQLGTELQEYEGTVTWRAGVELGDPTAQVTITGSLFAQACEAQRCFAPQTYPFTAHLDPETRLSTFEDVPGNSDIVDATDSSGEISFAKSEASDHSGSGNLQVGGATNLANNSQTASHSEATDQPIDEFSLAALRVEPTSQARSALTVLPLAFVAGFLLNFMPCVLPVVGLKLLSFVQQSNSDRKRILLMNVAYTAGLLSVMIVLATLAVFAGLGWGEQFSSAGFTVTLSAIVFAFGLSFLGVWEIPLPGFVGASSGPSSKQEGYAGAFSKGILSTLLATPCSGPFLGAALAWAVTQPAHLTYSVFVAVGMGMASPYLVVGMFPSTIRFLPKPGNWMVTFKQVMGFIMLATVVYLMSFMPVASVVPTVLLLLGIGLAVWFASRTPAYRPTLDQAKAWSAATAIIAVTALVSFGWLQDVMQQRFERAASRLLERNSEEFSLVSSGRPPSDRIEWQAYSPELLENLVREGRPVFVDFTADWCLTCKANEASAIETDAVAMAIRHSDAVAIRADKTEPNAEVDALLRQLGNSAASIPFYAVFPAGDPGNPILLDGVFASPDPFVDALNSARGSSEERQISS
ncbi:MAG: cytochrome c biogenesis protein CcdA [Planctomycetota bacterium]